MKRKTWHLIHKWIAIVVGVFFLVWTVTGIVMMLPARWFAPSVLETTRAPNYRAASLSPAEAASALEASLGESVDVAWAGLKQVKETIVYELYLVDQGVYLVSASSGEIVWITPELAEAIARERVAMTGEEGVQAQLSSIERLEAHDLLYPFGNLPVYRVQFEGDGSNLYYVSALNGSLSQSNSLARMRAAISSLHTFEPIKLFTDSDTVRKGLLVILSMVGILTSLTGYILFLLPYIRQKPARKTANDLAPRATERPKTDSDR